MRKLGSELEPRHTSRRKGAGGFGLRKVALVCRDCGAPVDGDVALPSRCRFCGTDTHIDQSTRQRLAEHLARMQRAADKARCVLRGQILALLLPSLMRRSKVYLYGSLFILIIGLPVLLCVGMLPFAFLDGASKDQELVLVVVGVAVLGIAILLGVLAFPAGLYLASREGHKADIAAARGAREVIARAEAVAPTRCANCGGHAQVVVIGQRAAVPCPWCKSNITVECLDAAKAAADAIVLAQQTTTDGALRRARVKGGLPARNRHRFQLPGFEFEGGVYVGVIHGVAAWIAFDAQDFLDGGMHARVEVDRSTRLPGAVWFVRREMTERHAQLLEAYGLRPPPPAPAGAAAIDGPFFVLADAGVDVGSVAGRPAVRDVLASLAETECVRFDPAGASLWGTTRGPFASSQRGAAHAQTLVRAVLELG